jgi:glycosyltransferase involved in cell wall biosynthesis
MRLLHCIHSLDPRGGGPADFVQQSATLQAKYDFELQVACLDSPDAKWLNDFPAKVHAFGPGLSSYGYAPRFPAWLKQNAPSFDAIIINGIWQYASYGAWQALRTRRVPYIVFPHGMLDPWFNQAYPLKRLKKQLYWLLAERHVLRDAAAVFFTSATEMARAAESFAPYKVNGLTVPYGTNPPPENPEAARQDFENRHPELRGKMIFLFLGRLHEKKGCELLIAAFKQLASQNPDVRLIVAGPGDPDYARKIELDIAVHPAITRIDLVSGKEKWGLLAAADALVLPSHQENFARVVSEALSCGTPALLSDKVNIWDQVAADGAGLVAADNIDGVMSLLERFSRLSLQERQAMRACATESYRRNFDLSSNFPTYLRMLSEIVSAHQSAEGRGR